MHLTFSRTSMPALAAALGLAAAFGPAAVAGAAKPKHGAHFKGSTAAAPINGFHAPVTFTVSADGRTLKNFTYGSFGCFGAGGFAPGVNPYQRDALFHLGTAHVSPAGKIAVSGAKIKVSGKGFTVLTTVSISGSFATASSAHGTITFSQVSSGSFKSSCGPAKIAFHASA